MGSLSLSLPPLSCAKNETQDLTNAGIFLIGHCIRHTFEKEEISLSLFKEKHYVIGNAKRIN
jgi:hypothetical protein